MTSQVKKISKSATLDLLKVDDQWWTLLAMGSLYIGFGLAGGVIQGALPPILRAAGYSIGDVGWLFALYLPFGLTFLWASYVDRFSMPFLGKRTGWIIAMQSIAALALFAVANGEGLSAGTLFALGLVSVVFLATMDVALDALAVEQISPAWRPKAAATKLAALGIGGIIGGGLFVPLFDWLGWRDAFMFLGFAMLVIALPILSLVKKDREIEQQKSAAAAHVIKEARPSLLSMLRDRQLLYRLLVLTFACCVIFPLAGLNRIMLVDIGVPLERIGWIVGTLGPIAMMVAAVVSVPLMERCGLLRALYVFAGVCLIALLALLAGNIGRMELIAIAGATILTGAVSGMFVAMVTKIIGWADGDQPATDYAAYYGISRITSTLAMIAAAQFISLIGWPAFYLLGAISIPFVVLVLRNALTEGAA